MSRKVLICGASGGLGKALLDLYQSDENATAIGIARKVPDACSSEFHTVDVTDASAVASLVDTVKKSHSAIDTVVYCCSAWGENKDYKSSDIYEFIKPGPFAFLDLIRSFMDKSALSDTSTIISIGSTATLKNNSAMYGSNTPVYTISKSIQRYISYDMQRVYKGTNHRFTTITVGGLGDDRIPATDVKNVIDCVSHLSPVSKPYEIIIPGREDIVGN